MSKGKKPALTDETPIPNTIGDALKGRRCFVPYLATENGTRGWVLDELVSDGNGGWVLKRLHDPDLFDVTMDKFAVEMVKESQRC
jgi:hypothetical protein